mmetsp:Transcript_20057/g.50608  ORF Transcript_20057/g.50608 Transcript_20057/m.50608 type:complete len:344 (+) Transcript_20057:5422-6453(+)
MPPHVVALLHFQCPHAAALRDFGENATLRHQLPHAGRCSLRSVAVRVKLREGLRRLHASVHVFEFFLCVVGRLRRGEAVELLHRPHRVLCVADLLQHAHLLARRLQIRGRESRVRVVHGIWVRGRDRGERVGRPLHDGVAGDSPRFSHLLRHVVGHVGHGGELVRQVALRGVGEVHQLAHLERSRLNPEVPAVLRVVVGQQVVVVIQQKPQLPVLLVVVRDEAATGLLEGAVGVRVDRDLVQAAVDALQLAVRDLRIVLLLVEGEKHAAAAQLLGGLQAALQNPLVEALGVQFPRLRHAQLALLLDGLVLQHAHSRQVDHLLEHDLVEPGLLLLPRAVAVERT